MYKLLFQELLDKLSDGLLNKLLGDLLGESFDGQVDKLHMFYWMEYSINY